MTDPQGTESRQALQSYLQNLQDAVFVHDLDGEIRLVNQTAVDRLGYDTASELVGSLVRDVDAPDFHDSIPDRIRAIEEEGSATFESVHVRKDGSRIPVEITSSLIRDLEEPLIISVARDISDRKAREDVLYGTHQRYKSLFENNPLVIWEEDFSTVKQHLDELAQEVDSLETYLDTHPEEVRRLVDEIEVIDVNQNAVESYGATSKEELLNNMDQIFTEDSLQNFVSELVAIAEGNTRHRLETVSQTLDGEQKEELIELFVPEAYADDYSRVYLSVIDITDRKAKERELEEKRDRVTALFQNSRDAICYCEFEDGEPIIREINPAFEDTFGYRSEAAIGKSIDDIVVPDEHEGEAANINERVLAGERLENEVRRKTTDGLRDFILRSIPLEPGESGEKSYAIYSDITEQKEIERELRRKNERLDEFASAISHDLRNPLNVAQGRATLVRDDSECPHIDPMLEALDRMDDIIQDTLTLARQGETVGEKEAITLAELIGNCWQMVDTTEASIEIVDELRIQGDPDRLRHVFENLFRNAVEHGRKDTNVRVGGIDSHGFYVEDDGPGIPASEREDVFEPGHKGKSGGTGFGLTIVKRIAEAHGWTVSLTESDSGGARFEFTGVDIVS